MKKTSLLVGSFMVSSLILAGCFGTKTGSKEDFVIPSCNDYVKLMKCVAEKSGGGQEALGAVDKAIAAWKTLPEDQLTQTCNMAVAAVAANASAYVQLGCEVPVAANTTKEAVVDTTEVLTGTVNPVVTGTAIKTTGEDNKIVQAVVNEVASGTSAQ